MLLLIWKARCSKRMCLYFDVLMFPICLFTFQFSNKTRRLCKYITRLFENIIYHKEKYTRSQQDSGLLCIYSFFTLHLCDSARSMLSWLVILSLDQLTICHNLLIFSIWKEFEEQIVLFIPGIVDIAVYVTCPQRKHLDLFLLNIGLIWSFKVDVLISTSKRK